MTLLLHVSDPQFGTEQPSVVAALERLAAAERPDVLLLTGNLTAQGTDEQFQAARAFADRLQVPHRVAVAGPLDLPRRSLKQRLLRPFARFQAAFGDDLAPVLEHPSVLVMGVNTARRWRPVGGTISAAQVATVARRMAAAAPRQWRLVLTHHPLAVPRSGEDGHLVRGHGHAIKSWRQAGVDLLLGGHLGLPFTRPLVATGSAARVLTVVQAGSAVSTRLRPDLPNSVNLIRVVDRAPDEPGPRQAVVERWDYQAAGGSFTCVGRRELRGR